MRPCPGAMSDACQFELTTKRRRRDIREGGKNGGVSVLRTDRVDRGAGRSILLHAVLSCHRFKRSPRTTNQRGINDPYDNQDQGEKSSIPVGGESITSPVLSMTIFVRNGGIKVD